jgi:hypothetical protein
MHPAFRVRTFFLALTLSVLSVAQAVEFSHAAQPRLATTAAGRVYLAYGSGGTVYVARSDNGGTTFAPAVAAASVPKLMLGLRRGPRLAAQGENVTVTFIGSELLAVHSTDGGRTWSEPVAVNTVPTSAREGLHDLAGGPAGRLFVTWLDLRNGKMELWGAESTDAGRTWGTNARVYQSPAKSICECCHPSALFDAAGNLAVMWRNEIGGDRDMWLAVRPAGAKEFDDAHKLGLGTWTLKACPMDGGALVALGAGRFASVWQRAGEVFFCPTVGPEIKLGAGKQPLVLLEGGKPLVLWQQGSVLAAAKVGESVELLPATPEARFAVMTPLPSGRGTLVAYETGPTKSPRIVVERR